MEYSDLGTGDFRAPSFQVANPNGSVITPVRYQSHRIVKGKVEIPDYMPGIRGTPEVNSDCFGEICFFNQVYPKSF